MGNGVEYCYNADAIIEERRRRAQPEPLPHPKDVFSVSQHTRFNMGIGRKMPYEALRGKGRRI